MYYVILRGKNNSVVQQILKESFRISTVAAQVLFGLYAGVVTTQFNNRAPYPATKGPLMIDSWAGTTPEEACCGMY